MPAFKSHETKVADIPWDAAAQKTKVRSGEKRAYYAQIYAWYDPAADEGNKSDYKFIHHEVDADGTPSEAVTTACTTGIGVLNGGMGGTTIPQADRQGVWDHLAKHLRDADREPPPLNSSVASTPMSLDRGLLLMHAQSEVWAILPDFLRAALNKSTAESIVEARSDADLLAMTRPGPKSGRVARIPIMGAISRRDSIWSSLFGGTSVEGLKKSMRDVAADDSIGTVVLDIDSPGGTVSGLPDLAGEVRRLKAAKHVVALSNSLTASAAYWIASQADEIVATPEALVGSIGVFAVHKDWSKFYEANGVKLTYIAAGKYKVEGNPDEPLTDEARSHMQAIVDDAYDLFTVDVAKGRGVSPAEVRANYGEGRVLTASAAKAAGMVDRIAGADETLQRLTGRRAELTEVGNSQARIALMRRRLEIAQKYFEEDEHG